MSRRSKIGRYASKETMTDRLERASPVSVSMSGLIGGYKRAAERQQELRDRGGVLYCYGKPSLPKLKFMGEK